MVAVALCTREKVQRALDQASSVRNNSRIDDAIAAATEDVEGATHRRWYPTTATRYPRSRQIEGDTLWLNSMEFELLSLTAFTVAGTSYAQAVDYRLEGEGPSYERLKLLTGSSATFSIEPFDMILTGEFGSSNRTRAAGSLAANINASVTSMTISDSGPAGIGVGDLVTIGTERVIVTEKSLVYIGATVTGAVAASNGATTIPVSDGTLVKLGEVITVGGERMFVEDIAGSNLIVRRGWAGSVLETHANTDAVFAPRVCTIERAATGSTAASHTAGDVLYRNDPPPLVQEAALAYALVHLEQSKAAYGRVVGSGDNAREAGGRGLKQIEDELIRRHGRVRYGSA